MTVSGGQILKYTILPGILPRIYQLFVSGFGQVPYFIAIIYQTVGLLPHGHAYLDPRNIGRYGIRHVIAEAANNLILDRKHIDQVIIFAVIMVGAILLMLQVMLLFLAFMTQKSVLASITHANLVYETSIYSPDGPGQDLAFMILDQVFGVRTIFNSCVSDPGTQCMTMTTPPQVMTVYEVAYPNAFHRGLHALLRFYSLGIFNIAVMVVIYFVITITAETAETGSAFGRRFNKAFAPLRLIMAFALLVPLNTGGSNQGGGTGTNAGLNGAQIATLWVAKLGSNFASNAWGYFNQTITQSYLGQVTSLIGTPQTPEINDLVKFMFIVKVCQITENMEYTGAGQPHGTTGIEAFLVRNKPRGTVLMPGPDAIPFNGTNFATARLFNNNGPVLIRFGVRNATEYKDYMGAVKPFCGDISVPVTDFDAAGAGVSGATMLQQIYYDMIQSMWINPSMRDHATCLRARHSSNQSNPNCTPYPDIGFIRQMVNQYQNQLNMTVPNAINAQVANSNWGISPQLRAKGWAGAAIWYNRLAELNGDVASAIHSVAQPVAYPYIMEIVAKQRRSANVHTTTTNAFDPNIGNGRKVNFPRTAKDENIALVLNNAYTIWAAANSGVDHIVAKSNSPFINMINTVMGTSGLFSMRANPTIHPLAQLSMLGKSMMYASIRNFTVGSALEFGGSIASKTFDEFIGSLGKAAGKMMSTVGLATMSMAFVLYYVLPFLPFIYFLFAITSWVKAIFEAIVAMPLWALAHIRIDGEGLGGPGATQGYFLLLEIFLRPILILFGLIASIQIFSALVFVMNDIFDLVVTNVSGFNHQGEMTGTVASALNTMRGPIDEFFFTALYVIMCYMLALGCFKLIDYIPNTILRWFGVSATPFTAQAGDSGGQILQQSYQLATLSTQKIEGGKLAALIGTR